MENFKKYAILLGFMELDFTSRKILKELDLNARISLSKLSKKVRGSRDKVEYRIKKMEKEGIIRGYDLYVDVSKLGYKMFRVYFDLFAISKLKLESLINILSKESHIFWIGEVDGFTDLVFGGWFRSSRNFQEFYSGILSKFRKYIKSESVNEILSYSYLDRNYILSGRNRSELVLGNSEKEKFDSIDVRLLKELSSNARKPIIELSSKLRLDSSSILNRLKKLEKRKIILGYRVNLDLSKIGRSFYSVKMYLENFSKKKEIVSFLSSKEFVTNFTISLGSWDVEFDIEITNDKAYFDFVDELKEKFPSILELSFFRAKKIFKIVTMPEVNDKSYKLK